VVEYLQTGKVSATHQDFKEIKYKCLSTFGLGMRTNGTRQVSVAVCLARVYVSTSRSSEAKCATNRHLAPQLSQLKQAVEQCSHF